MTDEVQGETTANETKAPPEVGSEDWFDQQALAMVLYVGISAAIKSEELLKVMTIQKVKEIYEAGRKAGFDEGVSK